VATGTVLVDFGALVPCPTSQSVGVPVGQAQVTVTGQTAITASSLVEAWVFPATTADHTHDEHYCENLRPIAGHVVAGSSFDIVVECLLGGTYGKWNIAWAWA